jgi:hypothetical protein
MAGELPVLPIVRTVTACCAALALLAGCAVVPNEAWTFDPSHPVPKPSLSLDQAVVLSGQVAELQLERVRIRDRIAAEPDAFKRQGLYQELHRVGVQLSPLERRMASVAAAR